MEFEDLKAWQEARSLNYVLLDVQYVTDHQLQQIKNQSIQTGKIITGLFNATNS